MSHVEIQSWAGKVVPGLSESQCRGENRSVVMIHNAHHINSPTVVENYNLWILISKPHESKWYLQYCYSKYSPNFQSDVSYITTTRVHGITPISKSLSAEARMVCPKNKSPLLMDYRVSKRMKWIPLDLREAFINLIISIWIPFKTFIGPNFWKVIWWHFCFLPLFSQTHVHTHQG